MHRNKSGQGAPYLPSRERCKTRAASVRQGHGHMTASVGVHFSLGIGVDADSTDDVIRLTQDGPHIELRGRHPPCIRSVPLKAHSSRSYHACRMLMSNAGCRQYTQGPQQPEGSDYTSFWSEVLERKSDQVTATHPECAIYPSRDRRSNNETACPNEGSTSASLRKVSNDLRLCCISLRTAQLSRCP